MIVKCSHCSGKMRVDENRIPEGQKVNIRCPHCKKIWVLEGQSVVDRTEEPRVQADASGFQQETSPRRRPTGNGVSDHTIPQDAFQSFRFPSESEDHSAEPSPSTRGFGIVTWILVSLGIVIFFALLVNIILSGPPR